MALALSQRLEPTPAGGTGVGRYGVTDEIFALAMGRRRVPVAYFLGLVLWVLGGPAGLLAGALVGEFLPPTWQAAFGVLLFGMFIAIVVPAARADRAVAAVVVGAAALSVALASVPLSAGLQPGWRIIIVTVVVAGVAAWLAPVPRRDA